MDKYRTLILSSYVVVFILFFIGAFFKLTHVPFANQFLILSKTLFIFPFLFTLYDIITSQIKHKIAWLICFILFPPIVGMLYFFLRPDIVEAPSN